MIFESTFNLYVKGYRDFNRVLVTAWQDVLHRRFQDRVRNMTIITHCDTLLCAILTFWRLVREASKYGYVYYVPTSMFTITSWVSASMPIDGNNNDPRFPFCYRPLRIQPERPFSSQFSSARCCRKKMHFWFSLLSLWTFSCCILDYWLFCNSFSSHFLVAYLTIDYWLSDWHFQQRDPRDSKPRWRSLYIKNNTS